MDLGQTSLYMELNFDSKVWSPNFVAAPEKM